MLEIPDEPRYVEAHGIAADPASWRRELGAGFALGHDRARLIVVCGDADAAAAHALACAHPQHVVLAMTLEIADALASAGRAVERAILHALSEAAPDLAHVPDGAVLLEPDTSLAHLPSDLRDEIEAARVSGPVWTAWLDSAPMSFAYAPWRSARWFDVSVDTLPGARQLGLGTIVAAAMIRDGIASGRAPVWGANESNAASQRLAHRLGFTAVDELWVAAP